MDNYQKCLKTCTQSGDSCIQFCKTRHPIGGLLSGPEFETDFLNLFQWKL